MLGSLKLFAGDQAYVSPPVACNCVELVAHTNPSGEIVNTGKAFIFTKTESLFEHELLPVTVTKYLVVEVGAMGLAIPGLLKENAGNHEYMLPPDAKSCTEVLLQITVSLLLAITGKGSALKFTVSFAVQPKLLIPLTKYIIELVIVATGLAMAAFDNPVDGVQV